MHTNYFVFTCKILYFIQSIQSAFRSSNCPICLPIQTMYIWGDFSSDNRSRLGYLPEGLIAECEKKLTLQIVSRIYAEYI